MQSVCNAVFGLFTSTGLQVTLCCMEVGLKRDGQTFAVWNISRKTKIFIHSDFPLLSLRIQSYRKKNVTEEFFITSVRV